MIITPNRKNILIDGGTATNSDYDIGKQTLLPYLLNHKIKTIDIMIITHFDSDHCNALSQILKLSNIMSIVNKKNIPVRIIKKNDKIILCNDLEITVLYPNKNLKFTGLNNNSIVMKLQYGIFSMLLTGDIEKEAEEELLQIYKNTDILNSTVLKVPHHGSKTSSTLEFLNQVKPKIALIGVGKNNNFGHPNKEVLERLKSLEIRTYRTDEVGEVSILVSKKGQIKVKTQININR